MIPRISGTLVGSVLGSAGIKGGSLAVSLIVTVVLARSMGPEGYGIYAFVLSLIMLIAVPVQTGLPTLIVREVAKYQLREQWSLLRGILRMAHIAVVCIWGMMFIGALLLDAASGRALASELRWTFAAGMVLLLVVALGNLRGAALRGVRKVIQGQFPELFLRPLLFLGLVGGVALFGALTPFSAMALHVAAAFVAFLVGTSLLIRGLPREISSAIPTYETGTWMRSILPLSFIAGMQVINKQTDVVMLGFLGTPEDVGIYRVSVQVAMLVVFSLTAVNMVMGPHMSRLYHSEANESLQRVVTLSARLVMLGAVPATLVFVFFGGPLLSALFGEAYREGNAALAILSAGQMVNAGAGSVVLLLSMTSNERFTARVVVVAAALNIVLNFALIPPFGIEGAAIATACTYAIWNTALWYTVKRQLNIDSSAFGFVRYPGRPQPL